MHMKRRAVALMAAVLLAALVGPPKTAFAVGRDVLNTGLIRHSPAHDGDNPDGNADSPGDPGHSGNAGNPGDNDNDPGDNSPCTSVRSAAPAVGPVTVCVGHQPG